MENKLEEMHPDDDQINSEDENTPKSEPGPRPSLVINIHTWATPIIGLLMLVVGLAGGYFGYPLINNGEKTTTVVTNQPQSSAAQQTQIPATANPTEEANRAEMMDFLVAQTRHFEGNEDATVTIIEFSDFQ